MVTCLPPEGPSFPCFMNNLSMGARLRLRQKKWRDFYYPSKCRGYHFCVLQGAKPVEIFIPKIPAAPDRRYCQGFNWRSKIAVNITGIRPGEKIHGNFDLWRRGWRAYDRGNYYAIERCFRNCLSWTVYKLWQKSIVPEISSWPFEETESLLQKHHLLVGQDYKEEGEFLRWNIGCVGICQILNELIKGNLERFVHYFQPLVESLVVYDDGSTDGSYEYLLRQTPYVLRSANNDFVNERSHKQLLLQEALKLKSGFYFMAGCGRGIDC
jgi:hypothetical protein